ncbi:hypothetical protein GCM10007874_65360 [Labrys miyagiensis]|uniref:Uncharacterized protein n=1 Tax=Labrys miyagiensis TaxID=346912 RepID=A0ABQ6CWW8_9HYPH|nr:hypothetical protein GCM10007874_65360 [Labrys miyagiensis]
MAQVSRVQANSGSIGVALPRAALRVMPPADAGPTRASAIAAALATRSPKTDTRVMIAILKRWRHPSISYVFANNELQADAMFYRFPFRKLRRPQAQVAMAAGPPPRARAPADKRPCLVERTP